MGRIYNFSAGPATLPEAVLQEAAEEMLDYRGTGMSVMEMSHRSKAYEEIHNEAIADLRELMGIPENYKVLFLQGGASMQFAMIPMNLMKNRVADYIITGQWAKKAYKEAQLYGKPTPSPPARIRCSPTYRTARICPSPRMRITSISARTTQCSAPSSTRCRTPRESCWWRTSPPASSRSPWM